MFYLNHVSIVSVYRYFRYWQLPVLVSYRSFVSLIISLLPLCTHRSFLKAISLEILFGNLPADHSMPRRGPMSRCWVRATSWLPFLLCTLSSGINLHKGVLLKKGVLQLLALFKNFWLCSPGVKWGGGQLPACRHFLRNK